MDVLIRVKIGNLPWKVEMVSRESKEMNPDENSCFLGLTDYEKTIIKIRKGMTKQNTRETVIHELVHAFRYSYGMHIDHEEALCDFFGAHGDMIINTANKIMKGVIESVKE